MVYSTYDLVKMFSPELHKPNPPTKLQIEKAKFVDKTYVWKDNTRIRH